MRRVGRWVLNGLTGLSLLLCVGACVLWVRSYRIKTSVSRRLQETGPRPDEVRSVVGWVLISHDAGKETPSGGWIWEVSESQVEGEWPAIVEQFCCVVPGARWDGFGPGVWHSDFRWAWPVTVFGIPPTIESLRLFWRAFRRRRRGFCTCSYDLTGNVGGVCPECGLKVATVNGPHLVPPPK